ncbi:hypothetical protein D1BOALGB6SA_9677 [Olavius sp. associated proteobacterium Delta 1]|nr:hypothetical protein D1BOALGB6SA_9677 [Olavius sp. associated proteobacterium Delta 1]
MKLIGKSCSFKTIPNGLRQHPFSVAIIHSALNIAVGGKFPGP